MLTAVLSLLLRGIGWLSTVLPLLLRGIRLLTAVLSLLLGWIWLLTAVLSLLLWGIGLLTAVLPLLLWRIRLLTAVLPLLLRWIGLTVLLSVLSTGFGRDIGSFCILAVGIVPVVSVSVFLGHIVTPFGNCKNLRMQIARAQVLDDLQLFVVHSKIGESGADEVIHHHSRCGHIDIVKFKGFRKYQHH